MNFAFAGWVLSHRRWVEVFLIGLTLIAMAGIFDPIRRVPRIRIDPSLNEMLPDDDPARQFYAELLERFGSDDVVLVSLSSDALFTPDGLQTVRRVTEALEKSEGVHHVEGLANALRMRPMGDDVEIMGFMERMPENQAAADHLRADVLADPLRAGTFVSRDGRATAILITFERMPEDEFLAKSLDLRLLEAARAEAGAMDVVLAGTPHIKAEVGRILTSELAVMVPLVFVLMSVISSVFFRSLRVGLIPVAAVALGMVWTVGLMGWVGHDLNIVTTLIPPLILALGFAYATHVVSSFQDALPGAGSSALEPTRVERARQALARVAFPVAFTALTTAAGFIALLSNGLEVIRGFGIFAAASTVSTLIAALLLVPLLLAFGRDKTVQGETPDNAARDSQATPQAGEERWLDRRFADLASFDVRHTNLILLLAGVACVWAAYSATKIEVNLPVIENFAEQAPIRRAYEEVDRLYGGANQFYVMLRGAQSGIFDRPEMLLEVSRLQDWLVEQPEIGGTISVVDYLEVLNEALGEDEPRIRAIPETENLVAQFLLFGANEELDVLIDRAHQVITIMVRSTATETREFNGLAARIDARLTELPAGITGHATGNAILLTRAADRIALGQAMSLLLAGGMIGLLLVVYFRSVRLGLYALMPNMLPVFLYFGLLGATGTTLNNSTALMGSIVLGIAVDDTLHLLVEYRRALQETGSPEQAVERAVAHVGRAITCTTIAVCVGLLVVGGSELRNQAEFGLLGAATLAIAWLVDVTVTPALCLKLIRKA